MLVAIRSLWSRRHGAGGRPTAVLREAEARFGQLFEQAAVGVAHVDAGQGRLLQVNRRFCDIVGYTAQELRQMQALDMLHADEVEGDKELMRRMAVGELKELHLERRLRCKSGELVWVDIHVCVLSEGEEGVRLLSLVQDASDRYLLRQLRSDGVRHLRSVIQRLPLGLAMVETGGRFAYWNDEFLRLAGHGSRWPSMDWQSWWGAMEGDPQKVQRMQRRLEAERSRPRSEDPTAGALKPEEYELRGRDGVRRCIMVGGLLLDEGCLLILQDQSQYKLAEEEIHRLAFYDPLTGLPNRRLLVDRLQQCLGSSRRRLRCGAVLLLDADNFKSLNDSLGLEKGDALLRQIGQRLVQLWGETVTISRYGGDDFVMLFEDLGADSVQAAAHLEGEIQRMRAALREPFSVVGQSCRVTFSVGINIFGDQDMGSDEVLRGAEMAMYQAKGQGRNTLQFFDPELQAVLRARTAMEQEMHEGLAQSQFVLHYQPQVERGRIVGAEGLLRWKHPRRGFISPNAFIPLAEETGLIQPLGEWVLNEACRQLQAWSRLPQMQEMVLAVNVSARQFHMDQFVDQVLQAMNAHGVNPYRLKLELTESLLLSDMDDTAAKMAQLKAYGVGFALDDFGTGYSSLVYLKRLPLDQLKIDSSFVRDVLSDANDAAIARTIVALGTSLGLQVMAEGVETEAQRRFLEVHQCHAWQGFLSSPPVPVERFEALVQLAAQQPMPQTWGRSQDLGGVQ